MKFLYVAVLAAWVTPAEGVWGLPVPRIYGDEPRGSYLWDPPIKTESDVAHGIAGEGGIDPCPAQRVGPGHGKEKLNHAVRGVEGHRLCRREGLGDERWRVVYLGREDGGLGRRPDEGQTRREHHQQRRPPKRPARGRSAKSPGVDHETERGRSKEEVQKFHKRSPGVVSEEGQRQEHGVWGRTATAA